MIQYYIGANTKNGDGERCDNLEDMYQMIMTTEDEEISVWINIWHYDIPKNGWVKTIQEMIHQTLPHPRSLLMVIDGRLPDNNIDWKIWLHEEIEEARIK